MLKEIRKRFQRKRYYNPFNDDFDFEKAESEVRERIDKSNVNDGVEKYSAFTTLEVANVFNSVYVDFYDILGNGLSTHAIQVEELVEFLFSIVNRNYLLISKEIAEKAFSKSDPNRYVDTLKYRIRSIDDSIGGINPRAAMEADIDSLNTLMNFYRYYIGKKPDSATDYTHTDKEYLGYIGRIHALGSIYTLLKGMFDDVIWKDGFAYFNEDASRAYFDFFSEHELLLTKAGFFRLQRNMLTTYMNLYEAHQQNIFERPYMKYMRRKRIKKVWNENGYLRYSLGKGVNKGSIDLELKIVAEISLYYPFMRTVHFPEFSSLDLDVTIALFFSLQNLVFQAVSLVPDDSGVSSTKDLEKYPYKIGKDELIRYLLATLEVSNRQVTQFLKLISADYSQGCDRVNLWNSPLVRYQSNYLFSFVPLIEPISVNLIDNWFTKGGISLQDRGIDLEKYLKNKLREYLTNKGFYHIIPERSVFIHKGGKSEEIDLLINLKNIVVLAEVKCIKIPMESRDYQNAYNRLKKGAEQAKRKATFMEGCLPYYKDEIGEFNGKSIVSIVITNYPIFTGYVLDGVPVVDLYHLEAYVLGGSLIDAKVEMSKRSNFHAEEKAVTKYYENEEEFSDNFLKNMREPLAVARVLPDLQVSFSKKSVEEWPYEIYCKEADYKDLA